jgi:hypothetical protein
LCSTEICKESTGASDEQGFGKPQGYKGKGKEGKGQGTDSMILNKPLTLLKGQGFFRRLGDFLEICIPLISECFRSFISIRIKFKQC